jgi:hypothetical protein
MLRSAQLVWTLAMAGMWVSRCGVIPTPAHVRSFTAMARREVASLGTKRQRSRGCGMSRSIGRVSVFQTRSQAGPLVITPRMSRKCWTIWA